MAEGGIVVEGHLRVERVYLAVGRQHERVDLDEVRVALDVAVVELHEDVGGAVPAALGSRPAASTSVVRRRQRQPVERVDVQPRDGVRVLFGDLLDVDAAAGRDHAEVQLRRPVEGEAA